jgi:D-glycero-beta-D-manno-heptose 1-phosphate adenylyltransferase
MAEIPRTNARGFVVFNTLGEISFDDLLQLRDSYRASGERVVTTNGTFELLHPGHVHFLERARNLGSLLVVGLNSDASTRQLKGRSHPLLPEEGRIKMLTSLRSVDYVVVFGDLTPIRFLDLVRPDVHCKAADYSADALPEAATVERHGGVISILALEGAYSTSRLVADLTRNVLGTGSGSGGQAELTRVQEEWQDQAIAGMLGISNFLRHTVYGLSRELVCASDLLAQTLSAEGRICLLQVGESGGLLEFARSQLLTLRTPQGGLPVMYTIGGGHTSDDVLAGELRQIGRAADLLLVMAAHSNPNRRAIPCVLEAASQIGMSIATFVPQGSSLSSAAQRCVLRIPSGPEPYLQMACMAIVHTLVTVVSRTL